MPSPQLPFFIEWLSSDHPATDGKATASITAIEMSGSESELKHWLGVNNFEFPDNINIT